MQNCMAPDRMQFLEDAFWQELQTLTKYTNRERERDTDRERGIDVHMNPWVLNLLHAGMSAQMHNLSSFSGIQV